MTKSKLGIFLIILMFCSVALVGSGAVCSAQNNSAVSGTISADTTWMKANSPYVLTGNVLVNTGATLTVQPGVTVNLNSYNITVNGALQARGSAGNLITFNGGNYGQIIFSQSGVSWSQATGTGSVIENSVLLSALTVSNGALINNNTIYKAVSVSNQLSSTNGKLISGIPLIANNIIKGGISINSYGIAQIYGNVISESSAAISDSTWQLKDDLTTIENNLIIDNNFGIKINEETGCYSAPTIRNNTIVNNQVGLHISSSSGIALTVSGNNIHGNAIYNFENQNPNKVNAANNYWGTANTQAINQTIYDSKNTLNLGTVSFTPFLATPNPAAPSTSYTPSATPIPTPIPTPSPTATPTSAPTSTPAPIPTATSTVTPTPEATPQPTITPIPTQTITSTPTLTTSPTSTSGASPSPSPTVTPTPTTTETQPTPSPSPSTQITQSTNQSGLPIEAYAAVFIIIAIVAIIAISLHQKKQAKPQ